MHILDDIPHLAVPIRYSGGRYVTNQQDTDDEVVACIWAVCQTPKGHRAEKPDFGIEDPTFETMPINTSDIEDQIAIWETRANVNIDLISDVDGTQTVNISVETVEE